MKFNKLFYTVAAVFALIAQPFYAIAVGQSASAIAVASGPMSVESLCIAGKVVHTVTFREEVDRWVSGKVFYSTPGVSTVDQSLPKGDVDVWTLNTNKPYAAPTAITATAVGLVWRQLFPFPLLDGSKYSHTVNTEAVDCRELNGENFNAVADPYKGISVGFNAQYFGNVSAVSVTITRADGTTVTKNANEGVLSLIRNNPVKTQLTAPFVIEPGAFDEADDTVYWSPAPAEWSLATMPTKATINVTDEYGTRTAEIPNFNHGEPSWPTYESLLPRQIEDEDVTAPEEVGDDSEQQPAITPHDNNNEPIVGFVSATGDAVVYASTEDTDTDSADKKDAEVLGADETKGEALSTQAEEKKWSLVNALLAGVVVAASLVVLAGVRESQGRGRVLRMLTIVPAVAAAVVVVLVEDFSAKLGFVSGWTLLFVAIAAAQGALVTSIKSANK